MSDVEHCPECDRTFDHKPGECWACGVNTVREDQQDLGAWSG